MASIIGKVNEIYQMASFIPGSELSQEIKDVIDFCKSKNNSKAYLMFNGYEHLIDVSSDVEILSKLWYKESDEKIKSLQRDKKLNQILNK